VARLAPESPASVRIGATYVRNLHDRRIGGIAGGTAIDLQTQRRHEGSGEVEDFWIWRARRDSNPRPHDWKEYGQESIPRLKNALADMPRK